MTRSICILLGAAPLWLAGGALAQTTPDAAALRASWVVRACTYCT